MSRLILLSMTLVAAAALAACDDLAAPDFNNPSIDELQENPTRAAALAAATGLLIGARDNISEFNAYVSLLGVLGRESYNLRGDDARFVTELLIGPLNPGTPAIGGNLWAERYQNIRNANILLNAVDQLPDAELSPSEKEAIRGFAKTIQALDFLLVINTRDANGAVIDVDRPITGDPGPIESRDAVFQHIVQLLEEARGHLEAAGATFPFPLSAGFEGFDTPATFLEFNRALRARVDVYTGSFQSALTALGESFLDVGAPLDLGVYHSYGTGSGDQPNGLLDPALFTHPTTVTDAEVRPGAVCADEDDLSCLDLRVGRKVTRTSPSQVLGLESDLKFTPLYPSSSSPVAIIRNEELILLRAEANIGLGNIAAAADDINFIRVNSGGLAPRLDLTADNVLDELLRQKRYSLLFEGGHRWIDLRRYDRLGTLPIEQTEAGATTIQARFPIPEAECLARGLTTPCGLATAGG